DCGILTDYGDRQEDQAAADCARFGCRMHARVEVGKPDNANGCEQGKHRTKHQQASADVDCESRQHQCPFPEVSCSLVPRSRMYRASATVARKPNRARAMAISR